VKKGEKQLTKKQLTKKQPQNRDETNKQTTNKQTKTNNPTIIVHRKKNNHVSIIYPHIVASNSCSN